MARRKPSSLAGNSLEALESLRADLNKRATAPPGRSRQAPPEPAREPDDPDLFQREMRDVAPIDDGGRAEIERPRPSPLPRPKAPADEAPTAERTHADPTQLSDDALFRASMGDVQPLGDDNRVDLSGERARVGRHQRVRVLDPLAKPDVDEVPPLLPADPEQMDATDLFRHAVRGAAPIPDKNRVEPERSPPRPEPIKRSEDEALALRESMEAPISLEDRLEMGDEAVFLRPGMPRRALLDLRRGRWTLQGELDLHGLTREDARAALSRFLAASLQRGARCVRVIHGKGLGSPGGVSILKQLSRGWLAQREEILAFCQAGPTQGGSGALLVLLRGNAPNRDGT